VGTVSLPHDGRRTGHRSSRPFPPAALRKLLRLGRRDVRLGVRQGRLAQRRRLLPGSSAQSAWIQAYVVLQSLCRVPHAGHFRKLFHGRKAGQKRRGRARRKQTRAPVLEADCPARHRLEERPVEAEWAGEAVSLFFACSMMSNTGPDGYPLDVHGPTKPLPAQDDAEIVRGKQMNHEPFSTLLDTAAETGWLPAFTDRWNTWPHHFPLSCVPMPADPSHVQGLSVIVKSARPTNRASISI
jgi:hypothetical protein